MRYALPTAPNECSYTTLAKMNCQISTCSTTDTGFISTKRFFVFSILTLHACVIARGGQFEHFLLKLFRFVSVSDIILFNFLNFMLTI